MGFKEALKNISSSDTLKTVSSILGGYLLSEQITTRAVGYVGDMAGININEKLPEVNGVITALTVEAFGTTVFNKKTIHMMASGGLLQSIDKLTDRPMIADAFKGGDN